MLSRHIMACTLSFLIGCTASCTVFQPGSTRIRPGVDARNDGSSSNHRGFKPYTDECTTCHIGYSPGFLPKRSWQLIMTKLENHFGQNAGVDEDDNVLITQYLTQFAADSTRTSKKSRLIARSIPGAVVPLRITETPFWIARHGAIKAYIWKRQGVQSRARCDACHQDAAKSIFDEKTVKIPKI